MISGTKLKIFLQYTKNFQIKKCHNDIGSFRVISMNVIATLVPSVSFYQYHNDICPIRVFSTNVITTLAPSISFYQCHYDINKCEILVCIFYLDISRKIALVGDFWKLFY